MSGTLPSVAAGYTHMDDKGRITLGKPIRQSLRLGVGSTLAWIAVGDMVMLVPQDTHLAELMESARIAFAQAGLGLDQLDAELEAVRGEVVTEHYGAGFFEEVRHASGPSDVR